jgi:hypothetical protein
MSWLLKAVGQVAKRIEPIAMKAATQVKPAVQTAVQTAAKLPAPAKVLGALGATAAGLSMAIAAQHPKAPPYTAVVIDHKPPPMPQEPGVSCENRGGAIVCTKDQSQPTKQDKAFWESYRRTQELQKQQEQILSAARSQVAAWQEQYNRYMEAYPQTIAAYNRAYAETQGNRKAAEAAAAAQWRALGAPTPPGPPPDLSNLVKRLASLNAANVQPQSQPAPGQPQFQAQSKQLVPTWAAIGAAGLAAVAGALLARKPGGLLKIASKPVTEAATKTAKPTIFTPFLSTFRRELPRGLPKALPPWLKTEAKASEIAKAAKIGEAEKAAMQASSRAAKEAAAKAAARNIVEQATRSANLAKFAKYAKYGAGVGALGLIGYGVYRAFTGAEGALGTEGGAGAEAAGVGQMPQSQIITGPSGEEAVVDVGMIPRMVEPGPAPGVGGGAAGVGGAGTVGGGEAGGEAVVGTNVGPLGGYVPPAGGYGEGGGGAAGAGAPQMPGVGGAPGAVGGLGGFVQSHLMWIALGGVALIVIALLLSRK